ncbi:MAG: MOSC domain-containing protein [Clostridiales Family XIII bacterium]|jgi:molybdenum cofactor synthesis domain-containing protein|nr:MOSC domain-containing protein [Clostridiales Family XIII bacterium]
MATVVAVCISANKGEKKRPVPEAYFRQVSGIDGDAHGDDFNRQISLLAMESTQKLSGVLPDIWPGDFAENILTEGVELHTLPVGTEIRIGEADGVLLRITQIGKECHTGCAIRKQVGDCVMPREGVFAQVIAEGTVKPGDTVHISGAIGAPQKTEIAAAVLTVSDRSYRGEREDKGGPLVTEMLQASGYNVVQIATVPDEVQAIQQRLLAWCGEDVPLIVTTGGTGFSLRDVTPEATAAICERQVPGIPEAMRAAGLAHTPRAMLSRQVCGIRGRTLILNLPGNPNAIREGLEAVMPALRHGIEILRSETSD